MQGRLVLLYLHFQNFMYPHRESLVSYFQKASGIGVVIKTSMEAKMRMQKVHKVIEELRRKGFDMTSKKFFETTVYQILKKYRIREQLDLEEYFELLRMLMDLCAENDLKNMGMSYLDEDDWKYK